MSDLGNKDIISQNIKHYMTELGKDRNQVCEDLDIKYSTFTEWVNGKKYPRIDKIEKLANYFGVSKSDLIEKRVENDSCNTCTLREIKGGTNAIQTGSGVAIVHAEHKTIEKIDPLEPQIQELVRIYRIISPKKQMELLRFAYELEDETK